MLPKAHAPGFAYLFAMMVGLAGLFFGVALSMIAEAPHAVYEDTLLVVLATFAFGQFVVGGACGLVWPRASWRWGLWLYGVPACIISFYNRDAWFFLGWLALTMLPACVGAFTAAALHPRLFGAVRN